jgi:hypothetical protein
MVEYLFGYLAGLDAAGMPAEALAGYLRRMERAGATGAAVRGRVLAAFDAKDGHLGDGQRATRAWLVHSLRVTRGQAAEYPAIQALAREHRPLAAALAEGDVITMSVALQLAQWTRPIPAEFRAQAEEIVVAAARAGATVRALGQIVAEIRYRTAPPGPDGTPPDRGLVLDTTVDGAGLLRGDLMPECAAQAVLDALAAPRGGGDPRTRKRRSTPTAPTSANRRPGRRARSRLAVVQPAAEKIVTRMRTHYDAVQQLQAQGLSKAAISRKLGRHPATVRKFASARSVDDLIGRGRDRPNGGRRRMTRAAVGR